MNRRILAAATGMMFFIAACNGNAVLVERRTADGEVISAEEGGTGADVLANTGSKGVDLGDGLDSHGNTTGGPVGTAAAGTNNCATNSNPQHGFTEDSLTLGTIIPAAGTLRTVGAQTARVMKLSVESLNKTTHIPVPYAKLNWGCPERPGVFGRRVSLRIFALSSATPEEALSGMRRLIDTENVFLVRDCYLQTAVMGSATDYQNSKGVPGVWCHSADMPHPGLAPWNYAPGTDPQVSSAIHAGYLIRRLNRQRLAILADPSMEQTGVRVVRAVADHFGVPIPDGCVVSKRSQEAVNGMRSEIARIRTCYQGRGTNPQPDAVIAMDPALGVFGAMEAESQGWRGADNDVAWACTGGSCWVTVLADLCGDACEGMYADCQALPCVPFADPDRYPAVRALEDLRVENFPQEPQDILTYAPAAITVGIALWLTMTGPDLSRDSFRDTLAGLDDWSAGIGPIINITPNDHFGAKSVWLIRYTGQRPYFRDHSGRFLTLEELGIPYSLISG